MNMTKTAKTLLLALGLLGAASASANVVSGNVSFVNPDTGTPGGTFTLLATPPAAVGNNNINVNDTLFAFNEKQNVAFSTAPAFNLAIGTVNANTLVSSHYIYFDPARTQQIRGSVTFDSVILGVYFTKAKLQSSQDEFGLGSVTYNYASATGLESVDRPVSVLGNTLSIDWRASNPGDHIRVITAAVPEPETYAMLTLGLGLIGAIARRRQRGR